eukprot:6203903-Pleurochrysis_carterae.AAC.1
MLSFTSVCVVPAQTRDHKRHPLKGALQQERLRGGKGSRRGQVVSNVEFSQNETCWTSVWVNAPAAT